MRWRWWVWMLVMLAPSAVWAQDDEPSAPPGTEEPEGPEAESGGESGATGLEVIDLGVASGYVRKPLELRLRRSTTYTWLTRGLLFTSEAAVGFVLATGSDGALFYLYLWPSFAATTALLSVSQARRGLREHRAEPSRPHWRTAGIITLCSGTVYALWNAPNVAPEVTLFWIGTSQLLGTLMIQLQGWHYRRDIKHRSWPPWLDALERSKEKRQTWVPVIAPTRGGALVGAAIAF